MAIYRVTRTSQPNLAPAPGSLVPGQLAVEMATQPNPRLWVGVTTSIDPTGRRLLVGSTGGGGGGGGIPDAPTDGQTYGRDGETQLWEPVLLLSGGKMTGPLTLNNIAQNPLDAPPLEQIGELLGFPVQATAPVSPVVGELWFNTNLSQLEVWNGSVWTPSTAGFLPITGGTMTGNLILDGPPSSLSNPNEAATVGYVDELITGALQFLGTINAPTGEVTYTLSSGITASQLVAPSTVKDSYVVCASGGTMPASAPYLPGVTMGTGDWVISDGSQWYVIATGASTVLAQQVQVIPAVLGATNVQTALQDLLINFNQYAPLISPSLQGTPTTPTPPVGDFSQKIANTAWVAAAIQAALTQSGDADAVLFIGDITGSNTLYAGSGSFLDMIILAGDTSGSNPSTLPNYIDSVVMTGDAAST